VAARGQNADIARSAYEAFSRGGVEAILTFLDPEIEWRMWEEFARAPRVYRGHDGVREVLSVFEENYDEFRAEPREFIEVGEQVVVPVRLVGKAKGTGEEISFDLVQVWTSREGKAARLDVYPTRSDALRALGAPSAD